MWIFCCFFFQGHGCFAQERLRSFYYEYGLWWAVLPLLGAGIRTDFSKVAGVLYRVWFFSRRRRAPDCWVNILFCMLDASFLHEGQKKGYHCIPTLLTLNLILWKTQYKGTSLERIYQMFYISICFFRKNLRLPVFFNKRAVTGRDDGRWPEGRMAEGRALGGRKRGGWCGLCRRGILVVKIVSLCGMSWQACRFPASGHKKRDTAVSQPC